MLRMVCSRTDATPGADVYYGEPMLEAGTLDEAPLRAAPTRGGHRWQSVAGRHGRAHRLAPGSTRAVLSSVSTAHQSAPPDPRGGHRVSAARAPFGDALRAAARCGPDRPGNLHPAGLDPARSHGGAAARRMRVSSLAVHAAPGSEALAPWRAGNPHEYARLRVRPRPRPSALSCGPECGSPGRPPGVVPRLPAVSYHRDRLLAGGEYGLETGR